MAEEIESFADAYDAARADLTPPTAEVAEPEAPPVVDAEAETPDETEASDPDLQAVIDEVAAAPEPESTIDTSSPDFWNTVVELEDGMSVPLSELRDGGLRQADYTRKTQALAEQRKQLEDAAAFYKSYTDDPLEFARTVAVEQGWLTPNQRTPVREVPGAHLPTEDEFNQRIDELVQERLETSPEYEEARQARAQQVVDQKFAEIESTLKVSLPNTVRQQILDEAARRGIYDLELVTQYWISQQRDRRRSGDQLKQSASARPQSAGATASDAPPQEVSTFEEAVLAAKAELSAGA